MGEIIKGFNLLESYRNGIIKLDDATRQQRQKFTGRVTQQNGAEQGGWKVDFNDGTTRKFDNLAQAAEWAKQNTGLIFDADGRTRLAGQTIEELVASSK